MPYKDIEKQRAAGRKYDGSEKGKVRTRRYIESHKTKLAKRREEEQAQRLEVFCRRNNIDVHCIRRLIGFHEAGKDIDFDARNARYVYESLNRRRFKKKEKEPSAGSQDYY